LASSSRKRSPYELIQIKPKSTKRRKTFREHTLQQLRQHPKKHKLKQGFIPLQPSF
jgi:hypothetical protein